MKVYPPRIALVHALEDSVQPIRQAFAELWPEAFIFDLLDTSLAMDRAYAGQLEPQMVQRFLTLGRYAAGSEGMSGKTAAVLFTCSAFGPAIDAVKGALSVPVWRPNEAAFAQAIAAGEDIGLVVTFEPSLASLSVELEEMARQAGRVLRLRTAYAKGALEALKAGDGAAHDRLIHEAAMRVQGADVVVLGQYSMARAADGLAEKLGCPVLTTPKSAVAALRAQLETLA